MRTKPQPIYCPVCRQPLTLVNRTFRCVYQNKKKRHGRVTLRLLGCKFCKVVVMLQRWPEKRY